MIKVAHESPKSLFKHIWDRTDYDYFLVHLMTDIEYQRLYWDSKLAGRTTYLDNSIFELGTAFDMDQFAEWVKFLKPDYYIVPDALEDANRTVRNMSIWVDRYSDLPGKRVGVIQGKTWEELKDCYQYMAHYVDMIAISFDYSYYRETVPNPNKWMSYTLGRVKLLGDLVEKGIIDQSKEHHLLGMALPFEGLFYKEYPWITSVDTSSPVVHTIKGIRFLENQGILRKESQKLVELINTPIQDIDIDLLEYNLSEFRRLWS